MEKLNWNSFEEEALSKLHQGASLEGKDGVMAPLIKHLLEAALEGELDVHLAKEKAANRANRRNGKGKKQVKAGVGKSWGVIAALFSFFLTFSLLVFYIFSSFLLFLLYYLYIY